ncbi:MAG TPA: N-acetylmuramoyl-L-alanine amidase [Chloroflexota bacterium]|nr:N-acetylmuramoyl-L-alanine amidase [Chloroflexota bacterium]
MRADRARVVPGASEGMIAGWSSRILLPLCVVLLLIPACSARPRDDGYAFLANNKSDWQRTAPGQILRGAIPVVVTPPGGDPSSNRGAPSSDPTPKPGTTPVAGSAPAAGSTLVFLDPGHGGVDTGTIGTTDDGTTIEEKNVALAIAQRTANHLRQDGIGVELSRTDDSLPGSTPADYTGDGQVLTPDGVLADLQRRIDRANASGAHVLLSIHLNAFQDPSVGGAETFYDSSRPFADQSKHFATLVQDSLITALRVKGFDTPDRGVTDDEDLQIESLGSLSGDYHHLVLLGPAIPGRLRASQMPGALSEPLFLSNPPEATAAVDPTMQELIATAYTKAIEEFLKPNGQS